MDVDLVVDFDGDGNGNGNGNGNGDVDLQALTIAQATRLLNRRYNPQRRWM